MTPTGPHSGAGDQIPRRTMPDWFAAVWTHPIMLLAVGGAVGTNARYWFGHYLARFQGEIEFPWATFAINVLGSVLLGIVAAIYLHHPDPSRRNWYLLLGTGFCGGFTTFSTFSFETMKLIQMGRPWTAAMYSLGSVFVGLVGVWLAARWCGR